MLYPGPINNLCFLLTFINILKHFNVTRLPLFTPMSLTNNSPHNKVERKKERKKEIKKERKIPKKWILSRSDVINKD